jgi:hypothetical protein
MNTYAEKTTEHPKVIADSAMHSSWVNNRPEALAMQNLQHSAGSSAQVQQLKAYQTMADQATVQRQAITGNSNEPIQLKTAIRHTTGTVKANGGDHTVGLAMNAELDPKDPVKGSATGVNSDWMRWIRAHYPKANVVRGHLLNHDLGGFGIEENLYPISTLANANHSSKVEQNVKGALTKLNGEVNAKDQAYIYYNVTVNQIKSYEEAQFKCDWGYKKGNNLKVELGKDVIDSKLAVDKGGFGGGKKDKQSPADWQHGTSKGGTEVAAVRQRLDTALKAGKILFSNKVTDKKGVMQDTNQDYMEHLFDWVEDYGEEAVRVALMMDSLSADGEKLATINEMLRLLTEVFGDDDGGGLEKMVIDED